MIRFLGVGLGLAIGCGLCSAAGAIWCSQFICFKTGEPAMGKMAYVGWAVLMASMILFSTLLGMILGEWKNKQPYPQASGPGAPAASLFVGDYRL